MPRFTRDEIEEQWARYQKIARRCGPAGDWDEFVDLYTEDAVMVVSGGVRIGGREAMRRWYRQAFAADSGQRGRSQDFANLQISPGGRI